MNKPYRYFITKNNALLILCLFQDKSLHFELVACSLLHVSMFLDATFQLINSLCYNYVTTTLILRCWSAMPKEQCHGRMC